MIKCPNCPYETKRAFDLKRHLVKKNSCTPVSSGWVESQSNATATQSNVTAAQSNTTAAQSNVNACPFECSKCHRVLSSKQMLQKHESRCNGLSKLQCPTCHKWFATTNGKHQHIKNVKCEPVVQKTTINNDNSVTNMNIDNSIHHTTNNTTNNITVQLLHFGNENIQHLLQDTAFMDRVLKLAGAAKTADDKAKVAPMIVQRVHFDPDHPENQTIKLTTQRGMYHAKVHTANGWERTTWEEAIDRVNGKANAYLEEHADVEETYVPPGFDEYIAAFSNDDKVKKKQRVAALRADKVLDALGA